MSPLAVMNSRNVARADARRRSGRAQRGPVVLRDHDRRDVVVEARGPAHGVGSPATLLTTITPMAPLALAAATFSLKVQVPRSMSAILPVASAVTAAVQPSERCRRSRTCRAWQAGRSRHAAPAAVPPPSGYAIGWPTKWWFVLAPTVMMLRARPGRADGEAAGALVAGRGHDDHAGRDRVVEALGEQVVVAVVPAAERQVEDVHAVVHGGLDRVEDVLAAGVLDVAGEHVVVAQPRAGRDARHVVDLDALRRPRSCRSRRQRSRRRACRGCRRRRPAARRSRSG